MAMPKFLTISRIGATGFVKFILKNWYFIILLVVIIPTIITSVQIAKETQNPFYPLISLGLHLGNADAIIYEDVQILKENPEELIGSTKPDKGIWKNVVHGWNVFKIIWKELGLLWMIAFPFVMIHKVVRTRNVSERAKNVCLTMYIGIIFIFFINLIMTIYNLISGTIVYNLPETATLEYKTWLIIITTLPFHGVVSLFAYLFSML